MRVGDSIDNVPVFAVIGVTHNEFKTVLELQSGNMESASPGGSFFKDLKKRGLNTDDVRLGRITGSGNSIQRRIYSRQDSTMQGPCSNQCAG